MSSWNPEFEISLSDSEDEGDNLFKNIKGRECILFIVDANLCSSPELLESALLILRSAFLSGLLVNDKDLVGLLFANTNYSPEPCETNCLENIIVPDNCAIFLPPRQLNCSIVKNFLNFVELAPLQFEEIYGTIPNGGSCNFSHVLRLCMDLVKQCNHLVNNTKIVFLTQNEIPHPYNSDRYRQLLQKAADLKDKDVEFQLIPMVDDFNYDKFYKEFICLIQDIDMDCFQAQDSKKIRELLTNRKFNQHYLRRSLGYIKFSLGPDLTISAQYFNYYRNKKKPTKLILQRTDSVVVQKHRITQVQKQDSEFKVVDEIKDVNIKNAWYEINLGSHSLRLSYEQVNRIRNIHSPGMVLLGFKPKSYLNTTLYSKAANFMYPDDIHIEGSKRLFRALWEKCIQREKIAVCLFMCKRKSMPRYVALVPIEDDNSACSNPFVMVKNVFRIIYLSCNSYIRNFNLSEWNSVGNQTHDQEIKICEKLVKKFRLDYKPDILSDPNSDKLQSKLLSLAFDVNYETLGSQYFPNPDDQNLRMSSLLTAFKELFGEEINDIKKRCLEDSSCSTNTTKKAKTILDINNKDSVMEMINNKSLDSCSKDQLIKILIEYYNKKVSKSKTKQDLLNTIYNL